MLILSFIGLSFLSTFSYFILKVVEFFVDLKKPEKIVKIENKFILGAIGFSIIVIVLTLL